MSDCVKLITSGIERDCSTINASIGVDKDLILINYEDVNVEATLTSSNREADDTNGNEGGLTKLFLNSSLGKYTFEGTDYSVVPLVTPEVKEDGNLWYIHSITFVAYSKLAKARKTIETLGKGKVVAVVKDRSTGLYEVFGLEHGLRATGVERAYVGSQNSNFYSVTLTTPDIVVMRESSLGELAVSIGEVI